MAAVLNGLQQLAAKLVEATSILSRSMVVTEDHLIVNDQSGTYSLRVTRHESKPGRYVVYWYSRKSGWVRMPFDYGNAGVHQMLVWQATTDDARWEKFERHLRQWSLAAPRWA